MTVALNAGEGPSDADLARLMRFAQWGLDEAASALPFGRISSGALLELAEGLEIIAGMIKERARQGA